MAQRRKKIVTVTVIVVLLLVPVFYYLGLFDRMGFRSNSIEYNSIPVSIGIKEKVDILFVSSFDTTYIVKAGEVLLNSTEDWYGKDHIILKIRGESLKYSLKEFKKRSWEKVKVNIELSQGQQDMIIVECKLCTIRKTVLKVDTIR